MTHKQTVAIVIPTYNEERNIERLLRSISSQKDADYSVVVVDQGSTDRTTEIARLYDCTVLLLPKPAFYSPPGRSRNLGANAIPGTIILHLDADMELATDSFLQQLRSLIDRDHRAVVIREHDLATGFWAKCKALERACYYGTKMEAARGVSRDLFLSVGGYDEDISSGEDFFITSLYRRETHIARDKNLVVKHHIGSPSLGRLLRKKFSYGRTARTYLRKARTTKTGSTLSIIRHSLIAYTVNWRLLAKHPLQCSGLLLLRAMEFGAMEFGMLLGAGKEDEGRRPNS